MQAGWTDRTSRGRRSPWRPATVPASSTTAASATVTGRRPRRAAVPRPDRRVPRRPAAPLHPVAALAEPPAPTGGADAGRPGSAGCERTCSRATWVRSAGTTSVTAGRVALDRVPSDPGRDPAGGQHHRAGRHARSQVERELGGRAATVRLRIQRPAQHRSHRRRAARQPAVEVVDHAGRRPGQHGRQVGPVAPLPRAGAGQAVQRHRGEGEHVTGRAGGAPARPAPGPGRRAYPAPGRPRCARTASGPPRGRTAWRGRPR